MYYLYHGSKYLNSFRTYSEAWAEAERIRRTIGWSCTIEYVR